MNRDEEGAAEEATVYNANGREVRIGHNVLCHDYCIWLLTETERAERLTTRERAVEEMREAARVNILIYFEDRKY